MSDDKMRTMHQWEQSYMNPKRWLYERLITVVPDERIRTLPGEASEGHASLQNILDISEPIAICKPAHPPSLCFFGSTLNFGGFFICPEAV
ncbi:MAG: hypothetical protein Q8K00_09455 [Syntrophales bacterium]|nr:hypothetical protein [Syntrophales bacterium]